MSRVVQNKKYSMIINSMMATVAVHSNGLFTLPDSDSDSDSGSESDSDSKPSGYIALCRSFDTLWSQIQIPILKVCSHRTTPSPLMGGTFDLFDGHCDRQNGLHTHFCPST